MKINFKKFLDFVKNAGLTPEQQFVRSVVFFALLGVILMAGSWFIGGYVPVVVKEDCTKVALTARDVIGGCESERVPLKVTSFVLAAVLTLALLPFIAMLMGFTQLNLLRGQIMEKDYNHSAVWLIIGVFLSMLFIAANTPFSILGNFLVYVAFAVGFFVLMTIVGAVFLIVVVAGAYKLNLILDDFSLAGSDSFSMFLFAAMLGAAFLT